jgi:hypothetical protein
MYSQLMYCIDRVPLLTGDRELLKHVPPFSDVHSGTLKPFRCITPERTSSCRVEPSSHFLHPLSLALLRAGSSTTTVTRIATDHGFWELGRFSVNYRAMFGETPPATLRRLPDDRIIMPGQRPEGREGHQARV